MRFEEYVTEDFETVRNLKKAKFDLKVALGELEYEKDEPPNLEDPYERELQKEKVEHLKGRIVRLKQKIITLSKKLGESIEPELRKVLDKIPDPEGVEDEE